MPPENILDPTTLDLTRIVADRDAIRLVNPQRFEMEHLDAIVLLDPERTLIAGFKDVRPDEFWTRGHMPGNPLMPGVIMCEAAAQLCSYYITSQRLIEPHQFVGFAGLDNVRFRSVVKPGDRLVLVAKGQKVRRLLSIFTVQGFVGATLAFHADVLGVPIAHGSG